MAKPTPPPKPSRAKFGYLISVLIPGGLPQLYAAGADNFVHALALVGDYCNNPRAKIEFEKRVGRKPTSIAFYLSVASHTLRLIAVPR